MNISQIDLTQLSLKTIHDGKKITTETIISSGDALKLKGLVFIHSTNQCFLRAIKELLTPNKIKNPVFVSQIEKNVKIGNRFIDEKYYPSLFPIDHVFDNRNTVYEELKFIHIFSKNSLYNESLKKMLFSNFRLINIEEILKKRIFKLDRDDSIIFNLLIKIVSLPKIVFFQLPHFHSQEKQYNLYKCLSSLTNSTSMIVVLLITNTNSLFIDDSIIVTYENGVIRNKTFSLSPIFNHTAISRSFKDNNFNTSKTPSTRPLDSTFYEVSHTREKMIQDTESPSHRLKHYEKTTTIVLFVRDTIKKLTRMMVEKISNDIKPRLEVFSSKKPVPKEPYYEVLYNRSVYQSFLRKNRTAKENPICLFINSQIYRLNIVHILKLTQRSLKSFFSAKKYFFLYMCFFLIYYSLSKPEKNYKLKESNIEIVEANFKKSKNKLHILDKIEPSVLSKTNTNSEFQKSTSVCQDLSAKNVFKHKKLVQYELALKENKTRVLFIYIFILISMYPICKNEHMLIGSNINVLFSANSYLFSLLFSSIMLCGLPIYIMDYFLQRYFLIQTFVVAIYSTLCILSIRFYGHWFLRKRYVFPLYLLSIYIFGFSNINTLSISKKFISCTNRWNPMSMSQIGDIVKGKVGIKAFCLCMRACVALHLFCLYRFSKTGAK